MFRLFRAICRLNLGGCRLSPEDDSKKSKHVAESCKLIKSFVRLLKLKQSHYRPGQALRIPGG